MGTGDQVQPVVSVEFFDDVGAEKISRAACANLPTEAISIRVGPHEVAHGAVLGYFLFAVDGADLVERRDRRGQSTVHAQNLLIDSSAER